MGIYYTSTGEEDIKAINDSLSGINDFSATLRRNSRPSNLYIARALQYILKSIYKEELYENLEFIINELISNASKANLKRAYFLDKGLNIDNNVEYKLGMRSFFKEVFSNLKSYDSKLEEKEYYVKVNIKIKESSLEITVENNSALLEIEYKNIKSNISIARKFNTINELYKNTNSYNEGSGYGLMIVILLLRKLQLRDNDLKYRSENGKTTFNLSIPLDLVSQTQGEIITKEIVKEINSMPQFPDNILRLQTELNDPDCNFNRISDLVLSDTNLSGEVLRIANSPIFRGNENTDKISIAVSKIGLLGLRAILYNYGANKILSTKYNLKVINNIKEHQFSVALISSYISSFKKMDLFAEDIFVAGLLHDMGRVIVNSINNELVETIDNVCKEKKISISIIDNLSAGYNHALIGSLLAAKWNFPEKYINSIKYHHDPLGAPEEFKGITYSVYLGNEIFHYMEGNRSYSNINSNILKFFNLDNESDFLNLIDKIKSEGIYL